MKSNDIRFYLGPEGGATQEVFPICSDDISITYTEHEGDKFFLPTWKGELAFSKKSDLALILGEAVGTKFEGWAEYFDGVDGITIAEFHFTYLDGKMDEDNEIFTVEPIADSPYDKLLKHLNDEIDLFQAATAPHIEQVEVYARPLLQVWIEGTSSVGCWLGSLHWERELDNWEEYSIGFSDTAADRPYEVTNPYRWGFIGCDYLSYLCFSATVINGTLSPDCLRLGGTYVGPYYSSSIDYTAGWSTQMNNGYTLRVSYSSGYYTFQILEDATSTVKWQGGYYSSSIPQDQIFNVTLSPVNGASGTIRLAFSPRRVAARLLANTYNIQDSYGNSWGVYRLPDPGGFFQPGSGYKNIRDDDPFIGKTSYKYYIQYAVPRDFVVTNGEKTLTPNANGLWQPNIYYQLVAGYRPLAPLGWNDIAMWYPASGMDEDLDVNGTVGYKLKHAYPLWSVLQVLLNEIDPSITFDPEGFSQFFNVQNRPDSVDPLAQEQLNVFLTPSSNILAGNYDYPAMKAKITLGKLLDALKKVYNAYWYIDANGNFKLEHLAYFEQGGGYTPQTSSVFDLTHYVDPKTRKPWSFGLSKVEFDTDGLVGKIIYEWPENASFVFAGEPLEMLDSYVDKDETEERDITTVMTDVDLMRVSTEDYSKDGFVMLCADYDVNKLFYYLPITHYTDTDGVTYRLQNGRLAGAWLNMNYRTWGLPCTSVKIENRNTSASSTIRAKRQEVNWPATYTQFTSLQSQLNFLIKTEVGYGKIKEISLLLYSRKIEAKLAQLTI